MSEGITIEGRINRIGEEQTFGTFKKVEVWLDTDLESKYPQIISVEFTQDNISRLDSVAPGDMVEVSVNIRGRHHEPTDRVFNSIVAWKIEVTESNASPCADAPEETEDEILF